MTNQVAINLDAYTDALKRQRNAAWDEAAILAARNAELERENKLLIEERDKNKKEREG